MGRVLCGENDSELAPAFIAEIIMIDRNRCCEQLLVQATHTSPSLPKSMPKYPNFIYQSLASVPLISSFFMASEGFPSSRWYVTDLNLSLQFHHHGLVIIAVVIVSIILFISFFFAISFVSAVKWVQLMEVEAPALGLLQLRLQYKPGNKGLDETTINSLPIFLHSSLPSSEAAFQENECSICLCSFEQNEMVKVIPKCLHLYHSECVDKWLQNRAICPLCRAPLHSSAALEVEPTP